MSKAKQPHGLIRRLIRNWAVPAGCGLVFLILLKFVIFFGYVPTASMEPTIKEDSFILGVRVYGELRRGDVVVFVRDGIFMVKRISGIPGDKITAGGVLTVPDGCYFVTGDNEACSVDSRHWDEPYITGGSVIAVIITAR